MIQTKLNTIKETVNYLEIGNRPWGQYFVLEDHRHFKVKKIIVKPGHRLSLQSHEFRSEHWVVVEGVATVETQEPTRKTEISKQILSVGENCFIPEKWLHRLSNNRSVDLVIIEVQIGSSTAENDIQRFEDDYDR